MSFRRYPLADDLTEEDTGTDRMLKEEKVLLRQSSVRRALRSASATASVYEDKPKLWTDTDQGHLINCARLTASSILDKDSSFWNQLPDLQKLEVEDGKELMKLLIKRLGSMAKLEFLSILWTEMKTVPACCLKLPLKTLILQQDSLRSLDGIESLVSLEQLDVSSNRISALPKTFGSFQHLRVLNVCGNKLKQLPDNIGRLVNLEMVNCSSNRLTKLPDSLTTLEKMVDLDISSNHIEHLPENFGNLSKLVDFRASGNQLTCLPESFAHLKSLVSLLIGSNKLLFIPMVLGALQHLEILNLRNNHISTVECALTSVRSLVLDCNRLTSVCSGICRCENLEVLSLERNSIKEVPEEIAKLTKLRSLQLSGNPLGEIAPEILQLLEERNVKIRLLQKNSSKKKEKVVLEEVETVSEQLTHFPEQSITISVEALVSSPATPDSKPDQSGQLNGTPDSPILPAEEKQLEPLTSILNSFSVTDTKQDTTSQSALSGASQTSQQAVSTTSSNPNQSNSICSTKL